MYNVVVEWLDEDKTRARFSLPGRQEWRAEHIDALIQVLAGIRSGMSPTVSQEPPQVHSDALHNPRYATELHPFSGGTLLEIRHPALGWMDFVLPSLERIRMTRFLTEQEETWQRFKR
ncbi:MAG TPA: hypothetical protein VHI32_13975 [Burkholderiales bacterium]|jgi:hypothetical protein|nr:hypothetical protein [Burkholderiales bacterium]